MWLFTLLLAADVPRTEWNARAVELGKAVFWRADDNNNGKPEPNEVVALWARTLADIPTAIAVVNAYKPAALGADDEGKRKALVRSELRGSQNALVLTKTAEADRTFVAKMLEVAKRVDALYDKQMGALELESQLQNEEAASASVFARNHGPWCATPAHEKLPLCNALATLPQKLSALYPSDLQRKDGFCDALLKHRHARALSHPFSVVRGDADSLRPVPYHIVFSSEMDAVSAALKDAATALAEDEAAMKTYLLAAAQAFRDNQWTVADEAWVKTASSKWYARIAPDEAYADPCARKAAFAMIFGRTNVASIVWQQKLEPFKQRMEDTIAELAGPPYKARPPQFRLPDFIDVIVAAGDARLPFGATVGQSLPVFGKVAAEGRRRTIAMTNLYNDKDSIDLQRKQAESIFCSVSAFTSDPDATLSSTILHESAHNLGPAGMYLIDGKGLPQIFGPSTSLVLSELHAQTAALYFIDWLLAEKTLTEEFAAQAHFKQLMFALDQIARGVATAEGKPKPYGALSAIQISALQKSGALVWKEKERAANKTDVGCLHIESDKLAPAIVELARTVLSIRSKGDKAAAEVLLADALADKPLFRTVTERFVKFPKITFVYSVE